MPFTSADCKNATKDEILNHFEFLYALDKDDWDFKGWCGCCALARRSQGARRYRSALKIAYDENGQEVELIETMKLCL